MTTTARPATATPGASAGSMGDAPGARSDDVVRPEAILGRRDVALIPWVVIAGVSIAFAASEALRDRGGDTLVPALAVAAVVSILSGLFALTTDRPTFVPLRRSTVVYLLVCTGLLAVLAAFAASTDGLRSVLFTALVLMAAYLGLVLPRLLSGGFTVLMLASAAAVHVLQPEADLIDGLSIVGLIPTGWAIGVLSGAAHKRAERVAMRLTRCDPLTATLNRRGFIEEVDALVHGLPATGQPIAVMIIDLDGFKQVNVERGNAAGDELLAWVGGVLGATLPEGASAGRLGSDEFAVAVVGERRDGAVALAEQLRTAVGARHPASVGVATSEDGMVATIDLLRVADAAMRIAKSEPATGVQALIAGGFRKVVEPGLGRASAAAAPVPSITFRQLRAMGGRPSRPQTGIVFGWLIRGGFIVVGIAGAAIVGITLVTGGDAFWEDVIRYLGIPWVIANFAVAALNSGSLNASGPRFVFVWTSANLLIGGGIGAAALSTGGGITAPVIAGLYLKITFDSAIGTRRQARLTFFCISAWWVATAILGPADALWAVPLEASLLLSAYALGSISRSAQADTTAQWVRLGHTDVLTGLLNRTGFDEASIEAIDRAREEGSRIALLAFDLDGFKQINEASGPAAGDAVLQRVAEIVRAVLPEAVAAGRLGGDEFVAAVPVQRPEDADHLRVSVERAVGNVLSASAGCAVFPDDGDDVESLVRAADLRCRAAKAEKLVARSA